jgi:hypothetical protein
MALSSRLKAGTLLSIASSTLTSSYQALNSANLAGSPVILRLVNSTTETVLISFDGTNDNEALVESETVTLNAGMVKTVTAAPIAFTKNLRIYAKGTAGTGNFYVSYYYVVGV